MDRLFKDPQLQYSLRNALIWNLKLSLFGFATFPLWPNKARSNLCVLLYLTLRLNFPSGRGHGLSPLQRARTRAHAFLSSAEEASRRLLPAPSTSQAQPARTAERERQPRPGQQDALTHAQQTPSVRPQSIVLKSTQIEGTVYSSSTNSQSDPSSDDGVLCGLTVAAHATGK